MLLIYSDLYRGKRITQEEFESRVLKSLGSEYEVGKYNGYNVKTKVKHKLCGYIYFSTPGNLYKGTSCPLCTKNQRKRQFRKRGLLIARKLILPNFIIVSNYQNARMPVKLKCLQCGHEFWISSVQNFERNMHCYVCDNATRKPIVHTKVGGWLKKARKNKGWTIIHLSTISGVDRSKISMIENGRILATKYERDRLMYYLSK